MQLTRKGQTIEMATGDVLHALKLARAEASRNAQWELVTSFHDAIRRIENPVRYQGSPADTEQIYRIEKVLEAIDQLGLATDNPPIMALFDNCVAWLHTQDINAVRRAAHLLGFDLSNIMDAEPWWEGELYS